MTIVQQALRNHYLAFTRRLKQRRLTPSSKLLFRFHLPLHRRLALLVFVLLVYLLRLRLAYTNYRHALFYTPPRSSRVDRSSDFSPPIPPKRLYTRHVTPWRKYPDLQPNAIEAGLTASQSRHRYFVGSAGADLGDGLGHRFLVVNYERRLAHVLNLTYVHRQACYGALTAFRRDAVDRFFGWTEEPGLLTRAELFRKVCRKEGRRLVTTDCVEKTVFCKNVKRGNGLVERLVELPEDVTFCEKNVRRAGECAERLEAFMEKYAQPQTLFYTPTRVCSWKLMWSNQRGTRGWFHERYWTRRRESRMDPRFVNIAVHIRRGDILGIQNRATIPDVAYAKLIRRVMSIVSEEEQDDMGGVRTTVLDLKFKVHLYSQGKFCPQTSHPIIRFLARKGIFGFHNVNDYDTRYVSEDGTETFPEYWTELLGNHTRISCDLHVSEDTMQSLEQMLAADILVGSVSAMSLHIGSMLSRGIPFLPTTPPASLTSNKTIQWDPTGRGLATSPELRDGPTDNDYFDTEHFRAVWREYRDHVGADRTPFGIPAD